MENNNFAKLFQIDENNQVLVTAEINDDDKHCLVIVTEKDGTVLRASLSLEEQQVIKQLETFNIDNAIKWHKRLTDALGKKLPKG